jgi:hypothetical protein
MNNQFYSLDLIKHLLGDTESQKLFQATLLEQDNIIKSYQQKALSGLGRQMVKWGEKLQHLDTASPPKITVKPKFIR